MKSKPSFLSLYSSLGIFGVILFLSIIILAISTIMIIRLNGTYNQLTGISYDKNLLMEIKFYLLEQELNEKYYLMSGDEYFEQGFIDSRQELNSILDEMYEYEENDELNVSVVLLDDLTVMQNEYSDNFYLLVEEVEADNTARLDELQNHSDELKRRMVEMLDNQLTATRYDQELAAAQHDDNVQQAILAGVLCLIFLPMLAVWAFVHAGKQISPLLNLTNAVIAIDGNQYRHAILNNLDARHDRIGEFAAALDHLSAVVKCKEDEIEKNIEEKGEQLFRLRRRGLLSPTVGKNEGGDNLEDEE